MLEEVLHDLKDLLQEGVERRRSGEEQKLSSVPGTIRSRVWEICRESLSQTLNQAKQEWKKVRVCFLRPIENLVSLQRAQLQRVPSSLLHKNSHRIYLHPEKDTKYVLSLTLQSSEDKLTRVLKETQEHHEAEIGKTHITLTSHTAGSVALTSSRFLTLQQV